MEDPVRYVPTNAPPSPASLQRVMHDLRMASERRAWAGRPMPDATLGARPPVATADGAADPLAGPLAELRVVTTRYVRGLRAGGARPEQMLVRVKAFVQEAMAADGWHDREAAQALTTRVVGWSISAYYDQ